MLLCLSKDQLVKVRFADRSEQLDVPFLQVNVLQIQVVVEVRRCSLVMPVFAVSRSLNFWILPVLVFGTVSNTT